MTDTYVVDTAVFFRWYIDQVGFEHAREIRSRLLAGDVDLITVDSVRIEFAHLLRNKGVLQGLVDPSDYVSVIRLDDFGVRVRPTAVDDIERAAHLALKHNLRFFDALVADRALQDGLPLLTADKKLGNALAGLVRVELLRGV